MGKSSKASSSVPSPKVRFRFGFFRTLGALGKLEVGACLERRDAAEDAAEGGREGGRGGRGDVERGRGAEAKEGGIEGKTLEIGARDLRRDEDVGIVSRKAAELDDGVEGLAGGTVYSKPCNRPRVACTLALEDAVGVSYRAILLPDAAEPDPEPDAWD